MNLSWGQYPTKIFLAALSIFVAVIVAYYPGLRGPFVFDDEIHILSDPSIRISSLNVQSITDAVSTEDRSLPDRPLAKISLAFNYYLSGGTSSAFGYKLTNLAIHLVNTWLVYWFSLLLIGQQTWHLNNVKNSSPKWVPILVAALWALHPLHLTTVLYVVQRMTSLATLFVLAGLIAYIHGRRRIREQRDYGYTLMALGAIGGSILGLACKENAVVLLPLILVIEFIFFGVMSETPSDRRKLMLFYGLSVLMPAMFLGMWLIIHPNFILDAYLSREFTLVERLLTESRVLWYYVGLLFIPDVRKLGLYHDDIPISSGLFDPWTTSVALLSIISIVTLAVIARRRYPFFSFAVLWFLVGHSVESSVIGLEIAHEHRNYLPDIGVLLAVGYGLSAVALRFQKPIRNAILLAPLITLGFATSTLAHTWASDEGIIESLARHHPGSARGQYMLAELYAEKKHDLNNALVHYRKAAELAPNETGYLVKMAITATKIDSGLYNNVSNTSKNPNGQGINAIARTAPHQSNRTISKKHMATIPDSTTTDIISFQLTGRPLTPSTLYILDQLASCTDQASQLCKVLYPNIRSWYLAVTQNPYISSKDRGNFIVYLFNLGAAHPDLDLSLQAAKLGKKSEPSNPVYSLMEANVYILRGELETADGILQSVLKNFADKLTNELRNDIAALSAQIELRRNRLRSTQNHHK